MRIRVKLESRGVSNSVDYASPVPSRIEREEGQGWIDHDRATLPSAVSATYTTVDVYIFCSLELASFTYRSKLMYNPAQDTIAM